ncbi:hypothetical protein BJY00DRAFT_308935 [Aspergillus carlsbadensis]|nr:hypothetical protein BJY00DRAFT_308935 [Aspergillus carlsbadensis]
MPLVDGIRDLVTDASTGIATLVRNVDRERKADWDVQHHLHARQEVTAGLMVVFDRIYYMPGPYVSDMAARDLDISVKHLKLIEMGDYRTEHQEFRPGFFKPMSLKAFELLPISRCDAGTRAMVKILDKYWTEAERGGRCGGFTEATAVSDHLSCLFSRAERTPAGSDEDYTLQQWSGWVKRWPNQTVPGRKYTRPTNPANPENHSPTPWDVRFGDDWVRDDSHPHRTVILEHSVPPYEGLLRSEVLTIIGLMRERLSAQTLTEHMIAPIQIISCMSAYEARILQADYQGGKLTIYKSLLWSFATHEDRLENTPTFLLYFAAEPVGDTKTF